VDILVLLKAKYPSDVVDALVESYREVENNFVLGKWKPSELDAGHFVEASRRLLEFELFGNATPLATALSKFTDQVLRSYENATGHESLRLLIPQALKAIYGIRNKRGVGHVGPVSPNEMDASYILGTCKWVLAEFVRLTSGLTPAATQKMLSQIVERRLDLLWRDGSMTRVLDTSLKTPEQVLVLLYDKSPRMAEELREIVEYSNSTRFKTILGALHKKRLIEYRKSGECVLTPKGTIAAEEIVIERGAA
jgi:hypothetical protein